MNCVLSSSSILVVMHSFVLPSIARELVLPPYCSFFSLLSSSNKWKHWSTEELNITANTDKVGLNLGLLWNGNAKQVHHIFIGPRNVPNGGTKSFVIALLHA